MNNKSFKGFIAQLSQLSTSQRLKIMQLINADKDQKPITSLINAQDQHGVICAHCHGIHIKKWGFDGKIQRYRCHTCHRTFNALSGTPIARLRMKEKWLAHEQVLAEGLTIVKAAERLGVDPTTAFRWRHRFLAAQSQQTNTELEGIVEADETYFPESQKGQHHLKRKARHRGGMFKKKGIVYKQIPVLVVRDRTGRHFDEIMVNTNKKSYTKLLPQLLTKETILCTDGSGSFKEAAKANGIMHQGLNTKYKEHVRQQVFHIQHVNAYHSQLKQWIYKFRGVATKYLANYLAWHRFQYQQPVKPTPEQMFRRSLGFGNV
jgi:transposase-like protein